MEWIKTTKARQKVNAYSVGFVPFYLLYIPYPKYTSLLISVVFVIYHGFSNNIFLKYLCLKKRKKSCSQANPDDHKHKELLFQRLPESD